MKTERTGCSCRCCAPGVGDDDCMCMCCTHRPACGGPEEPWWKHDSYGYVGTRKLLYGGRKRSTDPLLALERLLAAVLRENRSAPFSLNVQEAVTHAGFLLKVPVTE